ncbi:MAG: hypothetical protein WCJ09_15640 [Planctomycetota bacterium]
MCSVIDLVFDLDVTGYDPSDRYGLAEVFFEKDFEDLARWLGVAPLSAFYSDDPDVLDSDFEEDFFDDPAELQRLKEQMGPETFFKPADALKSVKALRDYLMNSANEQEKSPRPGAAYVDDALIDELTEVENSLMLAESQGVKFYFVLAED